VQKKPTRSFDTQGVACAATLFGSSAFPGPERGNIVRLPRNSSGFPSPPFSPLHLSTTIELSLPRENQRLPPSQADCFFESRRHSSMTEDFPTWVVAPQRCTLWKTPLVPNLPRNCVWFHVPPRLISPFPPSFEGPLFRELLFVSSVKPPTTLHSRLSKEDVSYFYPL